MIEFPNGASTNRTVLAFASQVGLRPWTRTRKNHPMPSLWPPTPSPRSHRVHIFIRSRKVGQKRFSSCTNRPQTEAYPRILYNLRSIIYPAFVDRRPDLFGPILNLLIFCSGTPPDSKTRRVLYHNHGSKIIADTQDLEGLVAQP